jgi:epoxyqueuosine reductase
MSSQSSNLYNLREWIKGQANELGFAEARIADLDMASADSRLREWLAKGHHGDMNYMSRHADLRIHPEELHPGSVRAICVRMDYIPEESLKSPANQASDASDWRMNELSRLEQSDQAVVALYARGRDYHKVMRTRLQELSDRIAEKIGEFGHRVFVDSAPVMEVELAQKSGIGWRGKHTLALNREGGSFFFLGEVLVDIPLPVDEPVSSHCGECQACIDVCPTGAILGPYQLDARRCISYLTIEHQSAIPEDLRSLMGNRVYGCDDCQLVCPWNKFAKPTQEKDFQSRNGLEASQLLDLFAWTEDEFLSRHEGSAIRRIGHERWIRNIAVALGNAISDESLSDFTKNNIRQALRAKLSESSPMVVEHIEWALSRG